MSLDFSHEYDDDDPKEYYVFDVTMESFRGIAEMLDWDKKSIDMVLDPSCPFDAPFKVNGSWFRISDWPTAEHSKKRSK